MRTRSARHAHHTRSPLYRTGSPHVVDGAMSCERVAYDESVPEALVADALARLDEDICDGATSAHLRWHRVETCFGNDHARETSQPFVLARSFAGRHLLVSQRTVFPSGDVQVCTPVVIDGLAVALLRPDGSVEHLHASRIASGEWRASWLVSQPFRSLILENDPGGRLAA